MQHEKDIVRVSIDPPFDIEIPSRLSFGSPEDGLLFMSVRGEEGKALRKFELTSRESGTVVLIFLLYSVV